MTDTIEQAEEYLAQDTIEPVIETYIGKLIRKLADELKEIKANNIQIWDDARELQAALTESNRQRDVMREALRYYADESNYYYNPRPCIPVIDDDGGERAQQALKGTSR